MREYFCGAQLRRILPCCETALVILRLLLEDDDMEYSEDRNQLHDSDNYADG